jgi:hypothetical protein
VRCEKTRLRLAWTFVKNHETIGGVRSLLLLAALFSWKSYSYPSFIGYGYTSCLVCHFNAFGNGPLTDYGRALGATTVAGAPWFGSGDDEVVGKRSGFLGAWGLPRWLRLGADYRGMLVNTDFTSEAAQKRFIHMQAEGSVTIRPLPNDSIIASMTLGYLPPATGSGAKGSFISREHYVMYQLSRRARLYAGLMDVVYGIRTPDHIASSRKMTRLAQNDQVHGVVGHLGWSNAELGAHAFTGNLAQDSRIRPTGVSVTGEIDILEKLRFGLSALYSTSSVRNRSLGAMHVRAGVGQGSSALLEGGVVMDAPKSDKTTVASYVHTQTMTRLFRGAHFLLTAEYNTQDTFRPNPRTFRVGPGLQWFPFQRIELRADVLATRFLGQERSFEPTDEITFLGQVHLWF